MAMAGTRLATPASSPEWSGGKAVGYLLAYLSVVVPSPLLLLLVGGPLLCLLLRVLGQ